MDRPIETVEDATPESFRAQNYLALNPDVRAASGSSWAAAKHFRNHGMAEGRRQLSRAFTEDRAGRARRKYARFRNTFDAAAGGGGRFRPLGRWGAPLPLAYGGQPYKLDDYQGESANAGIHQFSDALAAQPEGLFMDLGCGFRSVVHPNCLYVDVYPSLTADIVLAPSCVYPFADASFDGIACLAVLEHVKEPWTVVGEIHRMLKPGGRAFIDWPFLQPVHGYPSHYYNATREGLRQLFAGDFDILELDTFPNQTPDHTASWILRELSEGVADPAVREAFLASTVGELLATPAGHGLWARVVAELPDRVREGLACGNTLVARKR